jgi:hypothetical protein
MAMSIGGPHLLREVIAMQPNRWRLRHLTLARVVDHKLDEVLTRFQKEPVPEVMSKDASSLTRDEKTHIRTLFYSLVNMPPVALRRWLKDPRMVDGVGQRHFDDIRGRQHLRELIVLKAGRADDTAWTNRDYDTARKSIFVIQNLFSPRFIDYPTWATLLTYGHDWTRAFGWTFRRSLPRLVQLEAVLATVRHGITGKPQQAGQI